MAVKLGTENKRNVAIAAVLFCVVAYLAISQLVGGPSTPKPSVAPAPPATLRQAPASPAARTTTAGARTTVTLASGPEARKLANTGLDPALHLDKLALSESIEYAGSGRNIFSGEAVPVHMELPIADARSQVPVATVNPVYVKPEPPQIDLHYFGYAADQAGNRQAFLLHGDDIFEAAAGEIVNHRYKVVAVDAHSVQVTDLSYNNTQTLPLAAN